MLAMITCRTTLKFSMVCFDSLNVYRLDCLDLIWAGLFLINIVAYLRGEKKDVNQGEGNKIMTY